MTTHGAFITQASIRPHPNADRLKLAQVGGFQVVVGLDTTDGELVVFFSSELAVSDEYATENRLRSKDGGYFPDSLRVRPQKFRGESSDGYIAPLSSLAYTGYDLSALKSGDIFTELNGHEVCLKHVPKTKAAGGPNDHKLRRSNPFFAKHFDTEQLGYYFDQIPDGSMVYFTHKMHGTSGRTGHVLDKVESTEKRTLIEKLFRRPTKSAESFEWMYLTGTRNTVLDQFDGPGYYLDESFRKRAASLFDGKLHKGEIVYYEIVGYTAQDSPIMGRHNFKDTKDFKKWGDGVTYKYGQIDGSIGVYIYRVTQTTEDAFGAPVSVELSWPQVKHRAAQLGVPHVREIARHIHEAADPHYTVKIAEVYFDGPDPLDESHPIEGVVARVETPEGRTYALKHKGLTFRVGEGLAAEADVPDMELSS
jgi:hypothetical protein